MYLINIVNSGITNLELVDHPLCADLCRFRLVELGPEDGETFNQRLGLRFLLLQKRLSFGQLTLGLIGRLVAGPVIRTAESIHAEKVKRNILNEVITTNISC